MIRRPSCHPNFVFHNCITTNTSRNSSKPLLRKNGDCSLYFSEACLSHLHWSLLFSFITQIYTFSLNVIQFLSFQWRYLRSLQSVNFNCKGPDIKKCKLIAIKTRSHFFLPPFLPAFLPLSFLPFFLSYFLTFFQFLFIFMLTLH